MTNYWILIEMRRCSPTLLCFTLNISVVVALGVFHYVTFCIVYTTLAGRNLLWQVYLFNGWILPLTKRSHCSLTASLLPQFRFIAPLKAQCPIPIFQFLLIMLLSVLRSHNFYGTRYLQTLDFTCVDGVLQAQHEPFSDALVHLR